MWYLCENAGGHEGYGVEVCILVGHHVHVDQSVLFKPVELKHNC